MILPPMHPSPSPAERPLVAKLCWLVRVRWVAVGVLLAGVAIGYCVGFIAHHFVIPSLSIAVGLASWNLLSLFWLKRHPVPTEWHLTGQLAVDAVALTLALAWSGGSTNPLIPIVLIHASLGPVLLKRRGPAWTFGVLVLACVAFLSFQTIFPLAPSDVHATALTLFVSYMASGGVIWLLTRWLARTMTRQEESLQSLRDRNIRLDHLRAVGALAAGFAHEFATPLNTIGIRLGRLARKLPPDLRCEAKAALQAAGDCERTLRHFMTTGLDPENLHLKKVDLSEWLPALAKRHATARTLPAPVIESLSPAYVEVPLVPFTQTWMNLFDNAAEHGGCGGAIHLSIGTAGGRVFAELRDRGTGFPPPVLENFGKPFLTTSPTGTGLGLYNALVLAQTLGGNLRIGNDRGAVVRFEIPLGSRP